MEKLSTVLVCGSRYGDGTPDGRIVARGLREWIRLYGSIHHLVTGGRDPQSVDGLAHAFALSAGIMTTAVPALWGRYGDAAGPMRNRRMLELFDVAAVLAFPGGHGTADMIALAEAVGIPVWQWNALRSEPAWELRSKPVFGVQLVLPLAV